MKLISTFILSLTFCINLFAQLQIDQLTQTPATCETNGQILVSVSGGDASGSGYLFSLIAPSPQLRPNQSSNSFTSLAPGLYTVQVTDNAGTMVTDQINVVDAYNEPVISSVTVSKTSCPDSSDGSAVVNETNSATATPLMYTLYSGNTPTGPVLAGPQTSNTFDNLAVGQYTALVVDSCSIQYPFTFVVETDAEVLSANLGNHIYECTHAIQRISNFTGGTAPFTYTVVLTNSNTVYSTGAYTSGDDINVPYNEPFTITLTEAGCGTSVELSNIIQNDPVSNNVSVAGGCGGSSAQLQLNSGGFSCNNIEYCIKLTSDANFTCQSTGNFTGLANGDYEYRITDNCCSNVYTGTFGVAAPLARITYQRFDEGCLPGTNTFNLRLTDFGDNTNIEILDALPDYNYTDQDGNAFTATPNIVPGTLYPIPHTNRFELGSVPPGSYTFRATDECNNDVTYTLEVSPNEIVVPEFYAEYTPACSGNTDLRIGVRNGGGRDMHNHAGGTFFEVLNSSGNSIFTRNTPIRVSDGDYVVSVPPGTYTINYTINSRAVNSLYGSCPNAYSKTIEVTNALPPDLSRTEFYVCTNETTIIAEVADGTPAFEYNIRELGTTTWSSPQSSPIFTGLDENKDYEVQVFDACFRNNINEVTAQGIIGNPTVSASYNCIGNATNATQVVLSTNEVYGANYEWTTSNGTVIGTSNSVLINPLVVGETYTVDVSIPGSSGDCIAASSQYSVTTDLCQPILPIELLDFTAVLESNNEVKINWSTATEIDNKHFEVQRKTFGTKWTTIASIKGAGNSAIRRDYTHIDDSPQVGINSYRLKNVAFDGTEEFSHIEYVNVSNETEDVILAPNPIQSGSETMLHLPANLNATKYVLFDINGTKIFEQSIELGQSIVPINMSKAGIYVLLLKNGNISIGQPNKVIVY